MIRHIIRAILAAASVAPVSLALAVPASAAAGWSAADLTAITGAPAAASAPSGYTTNFSSQGLAARVVYRASSGHIEELSMLSSGLWHAADLTTITGAPAAASAPSGYTTNFSSQGPAARVVYRASSGHIEELSMLSNGLWHAADLTAITNAPTAASAPFGYTTDFTSQGPAARVVYRASSGHIEELSMLSNGLWHAADLSAITGAPAAASAPSGYTTNFSGQGLAARVVYQASSGHVEELSMLSDGIWHSADLTAITGAPAAASAPFGYTTGITGQGLAARVVYRDSSGRVEELSMLSDGLWHSADLTAITGAPPAASAPFGYTTNFTGQGPAARVVYRASSGHIEELSLV